MSENRVDVEEPEAGASADARALREDEELALTADDERGLAQDEHEDDRGLAEDEEQRGFADSDEPTPAETDEQALADENRRGFGDGTEPFREPVAEAADEEFPESAADGSPTTYETPVAEASNSGTASSATEPLIAAESAEAFMERWSEVQTGFIEDPRKAVSEADALVGEVVTAYQQALEQRRTRISGARADGSTDGSGNGGTDTEDLRLALLEYRGLLTELLPVGGAAGSASARA
jgi:hypothetical protein